MVGEEKKECFSKRLQRKNPKWGEGIGVSVERPCRVLIFWLSKAAAVEKRTRRKDHHSSSHAESIFKCDMCNRDKCPSRIGFFSHSRCCSSEGEVS